MARIRSIKPDFFRHEGLQDLEIANPGLYCMLVFAGLWTLCDSKGKFEYKPRTIKLDILPFINFEIHKTLKVLEDAGFIKRYQVEGKEYGIIESFSTHQRITGKEANEGAKFPEPAPQQEEKTEPKTVKRNNRETLGKHWGNTCEASEKHPDAQEGKGREGKRKGREWRVKKIPDVSPPFLPPTEKEVEDYFLENGYTADTGKKAFRYYAENNWRDSQGKKVSAWKQKMISVWFKDEHKLKPDLAKHPMRGM